MLDLSKALLPREIEIDEKAYPIQTDFRFWIGFSSKLNKNATTNNFDYLYTDEIPEDREKGIEKLIEFYNPKTELPRKTDTGTNEKVLDYFLDSDYIYSAFYQCYGIDLIEIKDLHWHKFLALLKGISHTRLNDIMGYRSWKKINRTYQQDMQALKTAWEIRNYVEEELSEEEQKQLDDFLSQLKC